MVGHARPGPAASPRRVRQFTPHEGDTGGDRIVSRRLVVWWALETVFIVFAILSLRIHYFVRIIHTHATTLSPCPTQLDHTRERQDYRGCHGGCLEGARGGGSRLPRRVGHAGENVRSFVRSFFRSFASSRPNLCPPTKKQNSRITKKNYKNTRAIRSRTCRAG